LIRNWAWAQALILAVCCPYSSLCSRRIVARSDRIEWIQSLPGKTFARSSRGLSLPHIGHDELRHSADATSAIRRCRCGARIAGAWRLRSQPCQLAIIGLAFVAMRSRSGHFDLSAGLGAAVFAMEHRPLLRDGRHWSGGAAQAVIAGSAVAVMVAVQSASAYYSAETKPRWTKRQGICCAMCGPKTDRCGIPFRRIRSGYLCRANSFAVEIYGTRLEGAPQSFARRRWRAHLVIYGSVGQSTQEPRKSFGESGLCWVLRPTRFASALIF